MLSTLLPRAGDPVIGSKSRSRASSGFKETMSTILPLPTSPLTPPPPTPKDSAAQTDVSAEYRT
eukprot:12374923-Prorocentrum_lima.AAC.1